MLTPSQLAAEDPTAITDTQVLNLLILVRQYGVYQKYGGRWPRIETKLDEEKATPTVKTLALKAILTALDALPPLDAESQGNEGSPGFFSVKRNWDILAQDLLDTLYTNTPVVRARNPCGMA
jgi:hypothetical protein